MDENGSWLESNVLNVVFYSRHISSRVEVKKRDQERVQISPEARQQRADNGGTPPSSFYERQKEGKKKDWEQMGQRRGTDEALQTTFPMSVVADSRQGSVSDD